MLWLYQRTFYGEITHEVNRRLPDVTLRERVSLFPLVAMALIMGLFSPYWMQSIDPAAQLVNSTGSTVTERFAPVKALPANIPPQVVQSRMTEHKFQTTR